MKLPTIKFKNIRIKMVVIFGGIFLGALLLMTLISSFQTRGIVESQLSKQMEIISDGLIWMATIQYELNLERVNGNLEIFSSRVMRQISFDEGNSYTVEAVNQISLEKEIVNLPVMKLGGIPILRNNELPDNLSAATGGFYTVFQVFAKGLIRVSTSVKDLKGKRAIGTYIPTDSPVYQAIIAGNEYHGRALVVSEWCTTAYRPIKTADGRVIGAIFTGIPQTYLKNIREQILGYKLGDSSYPYIMDGKGLMLIHPSLEGQDASLFQDKKNPNFYFVKEMLEKKNGSLHYWWTKTGKKGLYEKKAMYRYYDKLDWLIVTAIYTDEENVQLNKIQFIMLISAFIILLLAILFVIYFSHSISNPIVKMTKFAENLIAGNLGQNIEIQQDDEIGILAHAFQNLSTTFGGIVKNLINSSDVVAGSGVELSQTAVILSEASQKQSVSLEEASASMEEMSASIQQVNEKGQMQAASMEEVAASTERLNDSIGSVVVLAQNTATSAASAVEDTDQAVKASADTMAAIKEISKNAEQITSITDIISDIADQTNLLALNASIEAARAGEAGRGFAVVAKEISKLADKSAEATKEIERIIAQTGANVKNGSVLVTVVDQAIHRLRVTSETVSKMGQTMTEKATDQKNAVGIIATAVRSVNASAQSIAANTEEQASTAVEMSTTIEKVNEVMQQTIMVFEGMALGMEELCSQAKIMKEMTTRFSIEDK